MVTVPSQLSQQLVRDDTCDPTLSMASSRSGDEMADRVGQVWSFLDQLAEKNPEEYKRFIDRTMKERKEFLEPPQPVFCFSTGIRGVSHAAWLSKALQGPLSRWKKFP